MAQETQEVEVQQEAPPQVDEALLQEARENGWVDEADYKGDPAKWVDAETFVKRGREINPILRKNNERLMRELNSVRTELAQAQSSIKEFGELYSKMSETAYKRAIAEVKGQIATAKQEDNHQLAGQLEDQLEELREESKNIKVPGTKAAAPDPQRQWASIVNTWASEQTWYGTDEVLTDFADGVAYKLIRQDPSLQGRRELLDQVNQRVREAMPEKFRNSRRATGSPVASSKDSSSAPKSNGKKTYADLPQDAKEACDRMTNPKSPGYIKGFTKEAYLDSYAW